MHVNMFVWLKLYWIKLLKVELTLPDNVIGGWITPACIRLHRTWTGQSLLHMIECPRTVFDQELKQHKFVEDSQEETRIL